MTFPKSTRSSSTGIQQLPKTWSFTSSLPCDTKYPTPAASHATSRQAITPRAVTSALYTFVRPAETKNPELLAVSPAALRTLNIDPATTATPEFRAVVSGNEVLGFEPDEPDSKNYPWAQCYGGYQFGHWAGQLGDGRAISLFETTPHISEETSSSRYELQLKGAGLTPYSRFADGHAVLRSSIREFVVSEYLHAIGIPSTRALSLVLTPHQRVRRETMEPGAIVCRFAQSWLRIGTFDLPRARGDRKLIRTLADYILNDVFPHHKPMYPIPESHDEPELPDLHLCITEGNRYTQMYHRIVQLNALTLARWQAYGFMNGVLNTDNTSLLGLSMDFGPFAFMDDFDPQYTPNHDDHLLRYCYQNQPSIIWWNLVRLGEALSELIGAGKHVDDPTFVKEGLKGSASNKDSVKSPIEVDQAIKTAEETIKAVGESYKATFLHTYKQLMASRLGLKKVKQGDFDNLITSGLDMMQELGLDFNHFFRRLSDLPLAEIASETLRMQRAQVFFHSESPPDNEARQKVSKWLEQWQARVVEDWRDDAASNSAGSINHSASEPPVHLDPALDTLRMKRMKSVNPNFVPRGWILDEVIRRVEKEGDRAVLGRIISMVLSPFQDDVDMQDVLHASVGAGARTAEAEAGANEEDDAQQGSEEWRRWCGDVPRQRRSMQCSCSS